MKLNILVHTVAKTLPLPSIDLPADKKFGLFADQTHKLKSCVEGGKNHWLVEFRDRPGKWFVYKEHVEIAWEGILGKSQLLSCLPRARMIDIDLFLSPLNQTIEQFDLNSNARFCAFLAQIAHESGSLRWKEELASGAAYEGRKDLGNVYPGDGKRYKGRGLIQLTGRNNYAWAGRTLGVDLINQPELAATPVLAARIAGLYWQSRNLNKWADMDNLVGFKQITRRINGGLNGWIDRLAHWEYIKKVIS
jgi:putative chitinase